MRTRIFVVVALSALALFLMWSRMPSALSQREQVKSEVSMIREEEWLRAIMTPGAPLPTELLAENFVLVTSQGVFDRAAALDLLARLQEQSPNIRTNDHQRRKYRDTIVSVGRLYISSSMGSPVSGRGVASRSAVANFNAMAQQDAMRPPGSSEPKAAPAPGEGESNLPLPGTPQRDTKKAYWYTAVYSRARGEVRLLLLQLTSAEP